MKKNSEAAKDMIKSLKGSSFVHTISQSNRNYVGAYNRTKAMVKGLKYDHNEKKVGTGEGDGAKLYWNPEKNSTSDGGAEISLAHELSHLNDAQDGTYNRNHLVKVEGADNPSYRGDGVGSKRPGLYFHEFKAVQFENVVIAQMNESTGGEVSLRDTYNMNGNQYNDLKIPGHNYKNGLPEMPLIDNPQEGSSWDTQIKK